MAGLGGVAVYNRLVSLGQGVDAQWAQVENVYQRRADLVPNLVATVQGAANFEKSTLTAVTEARASIGKVEVSGKDLVNNPQAFAKWQAAQDGLGSALSRLIAVSENYPELKATQAFRDLQSQLEGSENRIAVERGRFNETAQAYNTARLQFPAQHRRQHRGLRREGVLQGPGRLGAGPQGPVPVGRAEEAASSSVGSLEAQTRSSTGGRHSSSRRAPPTG